MTAISKIDRFIESDPVTSYAQKVLAGQIVAGPFVRKACERHLNDVERGAERGLTWSPNFAMHAIKFFEAVKHSKGEWRGKPLMLEEWQKFIVGCFFGWLRKNNSGRYVRRFQKSWLELPKKNGKSTIGAGIGLYAMIADQEGGAEVYSAATKKDQARIVFGEAQNMVSSSADLSKRIRVYKHNMHHLASGSKFEPLSSDIKSGDGINPHCAILDEVHRLKDRGLFPILEQGSDARSQSMFWMITTSGDDRAGTPYDEEHLYAKQIVNGDLEDDAYFVYIACPDEDLSWDDERAWFQANPNLGVSLDLHKFRTAADGARKSAQALAEFKRFRLNLRSSDTNAVIKTEDWKKCTTGVAFDWAALRGRRCFGGVDLSSTTDITAWVMLFPPIGHETRWIIVPRFWVPQDGVDERASRDRAPYALWIKAGLMNQTPGNMIDYAAVIDRIKADAKDVHIEQIAFDGWNAHTLSADLEKAGLKPFKFPQMTSHYAHPTKQFLGMVPGAKFEHYGNPVLRWMASNLRIVRDHNENPMPSKRKSTARIDGISASIMALGLGLAEQPQEDINDVIKRRGGL